MAICGIVAATLSRTLSIDQALSGFSNHVIWLVLTAFFIARGFIKTGLGARIACRFVALLGRRSLGLGYAIVATDLVLAPAIPSITARAGAVVFPIVRSVAETYDSRPADGTERRIGAFLIQTAFHGNIVTSAMFLTAMAANPLAAQMAAQQGVEIHWSTWALAASVPGLTSLLLVPWVLYRLRPPEVRRTPDAAARAQARLVAMGPMSRAEWVLLGTFALLLGLWIGGGSLGIPSTVAALLGLALLLATQVLSWEDVVQERAAWNVFVWLSTLVMMASFLSKLGLIGWFGQQVGGWLGGGGWLGAFVVLTAIYFYSHYLFASNTAHVSGMYAAFLAVAIATGAPPLLAALVLGFYSNLFASMTHYGNGPAPVFFGAGYVSLADWWKLGAVVSVVNLAVWYGVGGLWWRVLGLW
jgi:DASS family divalent anion:Na+ symporter